MSFVKRRIDLTFRMGTGDFGDGLPDTVTLTGLRVAATATKAGGVSMTNLDMRVFGMPLDVMNRLTILGKPLVDNRNNRVTVSAGDDEAGMAILFDGIIKEAWVDTRGAPNIAFMVTAFTGLIDGGKPAAPTSYKGAVDAATAMAAIGARMTPPRTLENSGVSVQFASPYWSGTLNDQAFAVARDGHFEMIVEPDVIAIWPLGQSRQGDTAVVSAEQGMIGYPAHTDNGIAVQMLFNRQVRFGGRLYVTSILKPATGAWHIFRVQHDLESETPSGSWFTTVECSLFGKELPIAG